MSPEEESELREICQAFDKITLLCNKVDTEFAESTKRIAEIKHVAQTCRDKIKGLCKDRW